jgi:hypothetical protein
MKQQKFVVSRFENRNGVISWRVDGQLSGVRFRKNFKTKEEAAAEKAALELKALQTASSIRSATTFLADVQLREAEDAFRRLEGRTRSLLNYLDYALANYPSPTSKNFSRRPWPNTTQQRRRPTSARCFRCDNCDQ